MLHTVIYEVNLLINREIYKDYMVWLNHHIKQMLAFDGFNKAEILKEDSHEDKEKITVHYYLANQKHLEHYFAEHAHKMQQDGIKRFGNQFSAKRRILTVLGND